MRDVKSSIVRSGSNLVVIGNGTLDQGARFKLKRGFDFDLLLDPKRLAYHAIGLKRGVVATLAPSAFVNTVRAYFRGYRVESLQGDAWQQGGTLVIYPDGSVPLFFRSQAPGNHATITDILAALPETSKAS